MEPSDYSVDFIYSAHFLSVPDGIDNPGMGTGGQEHQSLSFHVEAGGLLVLEVVRHDGQIPLLQRQARGRAADTVRL